MLVRGPAGPVAGSGDIRSGLACGKLFVSGLSESQAG